MRKVLIIIVSLSSMYLYSQNTSIAVKDYQVKFNLGFAQSLDVEMAIAKRSTLGLQAGTEIVSVEYLEKENKSKRKSYLGLFPIAKLHYRYYYNFEKRKGKGRNIKNNSGDYISLMTSYINKTPLIIENKTIRIIDDVFIISPLYGIQRTCWEKFNFVLEAGLGYAYYNASKKGELTPLLNLSIGWVFR